MPNGWRITLTVLLGLIIAVVVAVTIAGGLFNRRGDKEARSILRTTQLESKNIIRRSDLTGLPSCVQKWLERSDAVGKEKIHTVRLTQTGRMRTEQGKPWMPVKAVQYINVDEPGFVWKARVNAAPLINMVGRDEYYQGHGSMVIKLWSLVPVVKTRPGKEIDQSTLVRFMAEMIWYPTAALNDYIEWEGIDANSARAVMSWHGVEATMVFNFDDNGDIVNTVAPRYQEVNGAYVLHDWGGIVREYREFNGIRIPNKSDVVWKYQTGDFNWLQVEITDIDFNMTELY